MNDLLHKIDTLGRQILEKENELQLLKDDLEAIRAALESALEAQQDAAQPVSDEETSANEDAPQQASEPAPSEEVSESEPELEPEQKSQEQQHEAIMRTIEEFSKEQQNPTSAASQSKPAITDSVTLGDRAGKTKLSDLKKAFGINERFLYANELFNGDMSAFTRALEELLSLIHI